MDSDSRTDMSSGPGAPGSAMPSRVLGRTGARCR